jgi:hypothetical protein
MDGVVYGDDCVDISAIWHLAAHANFGHANLNNMQYSGRPRTPTDEAHQNHNDEIMKDNRHISQQAITNKITVSHERVQVDGHVSTTVIWKWRWQIPEQHCYWGWKLGASFQAWKLKTVNGVSSQRFISTKGDLHFLLAKSCTLLFGMLMV